MNEGYRGVIRVALDVQRKYPDGIGQDWETWWNTVKTEHAPLLRSVQDEGVER